MSDLSLLSDARLVWAMTCDCNCKACQALDVIIRKVLGADYTKRAEVMNPPESAARGSEVGNLNSAQRDGAGAVPGRKAMGTEAQATQPSAAPTICPREVAQILLRQLAEVRRELHSYILTNNRNESSQVYLPPLKNPAIPSDSAGGSRADENG
jgi:hypothetical protein